MSISIPSSTSQVETYKTPRVKPTAKELEELKKEPTKVMTEGDVYTSMAIHFKELTLEELRNETITIDKSKYTYVSHTDGSKDEPNRIVVMRDPANNNKYVTMELSKTIIDQLKQKFDGANDFFERGDGALRLNGEAEAFVVGWLQNIQIDRNYTKSDVDGNGLIEGNEAKTLAIGFERPMNYDYIGKKIVKINLDTGGKYKELERAAPDLFGDKDEKLEFLTKKRRASNASYIQFENSIEKELEHTLKMDTDLNGKVSLDEGLTNEFGKDYRKNVISDTEKIHKDLLRDNPDLNDDSQLQNYDSGLSHIVSKEEAAKALEEFHEQARKDALTISTSELFDYITQNDKNIADTLKQLQIQTAKSTYTDEHDETMNVQNTSVS